MRAEMIKMHDEKTNTKMENGNCGSHFRAELKSGFKFINNK